MHWRKASLKPSQSVRSDWVWAHSKNCLTSQAQAPLGVDAELCWGTAAGTAAGAAAAASLEFPENNPVMACPRVWPIATPPAVAAICPINDGPWDGAIIGDGADGGACAGTEDGGGAALAAGAGAGEALAAGRTLKIIFIF